MSYKLACLLANQAKLFSLYLSQPVLLLSHVLVLAYMTYTVCNFLVVCHPIKFVTFLINNR